MKIMYLGTAAYEGVPSLFCNCKVCKDSRARGGKNIRSRSQALINGEVLIDFNADTVAHFLKYGYDCDKVRACLITHSHCDHLYIDDVEILGEHYSGKHHSFDFYASSDGYEKLTKKISDIKGDNVINATLVEAGKRFELSVNGNKYSILPLKADHDPATLPIFYSVGCDGKKLLYAHDTGYFPEETFALLKNEGYYDLLSLDCTGCLGLNGEWRYWHMSLKTCAEVVERLKSHGLVDDKTKIVLNHFSHNGGQTYDELKVEADKLGYITSFDGLEIEF